MVLSAVLSASRPESGIKNDGMVPPLSCDYDL
jgi:hypothetical protein